MSQQANQIKKSARNLTIFGSILIGFMVLLVVFIILQDPNKESFSPSTYVPLEEIEKSNGETAEPVFVEVVDDISLAVSEVRGGSLVTPDNKVVNTEGQVVQNDAQPMTPLAPKLTAPVDPNRLPDTVIKIESYANGFSPREFRVQSGQPVTIALTAVDSGARLVFDDPSLSALRMSASIGQTRAKTFNAPLTPGEYFFRQDLPGRYDQTGRMIVE
jgi:hypothetical protein